MAVCGLPPLHSSRRRRSRTRQTIYVSAVHSLPNINGSHDAAQLEVAKSSKDMIYTTELDSPSHKDGFTGDTPLHTSHDIDATSSPVIHNFTPRLPDECVNFKQLYVDDDLWEEDPLSALLEGSRSPLAKCAEDAQKLVWLKLQLIGENQEFVTPFGKRHLVYADHTASGRSLFFIEDFVARHLLPFYGNTHTDDSYVGGRTSKMMKQAEDYIKRQLGGSKDDALVMCGWGCTAAIKRLQEVMGIAIPSNLRGRVLDMMEAASSKEERWLVFTGPYEHHSNLLSWRQSLAEVIEIPANGEGEVDMGKLEEALRAAGASGRRQKMGAFSACSNATGVLSDTRAITRLLHKYGAFACFDFAAGAPHLLVEMRSGEEDGYDAIVMSPHKLLGGPSTPGILLMRKRLYKLQNCPPSTCGGGTVAYVNGFNEGDTLYHEGIEEREEGGTPPIVGKVRCALAFWLKEAMGLPMIRQRENLHMNKAMKRLSAHPNIQILGGLPPSSHRRAPIISFLIHTLTQQDGFQNIGPSFRKPLHGRFVVKLLNDLFGIQARGGCSCAGPYGHLLLDVGHDVSLAIRSAIQMGYEGLKPGWARISLCYSMTDEEVDYILSAIELLANYGQRFLALYDFDWHSGNWTYAHGKALQFVSNELGGQLLQTVTVSALLENNGSCGQRLQFRRFLRLARALSHLLPKCPQPTTVPEGIDPNLLLFFV